MVERYQQISHSNTSQQVEGQLVQFKIEENRVLNSEITSQGEIVGGAIYVRHGETKANLDGDRIKLEDEPLTETELKLQGGIAQTGHEIKKLGIDPNKITLHISPTLRCIQSAKILANTVGLTFPEDESVFNKLIAAEKNADFFATLSKDISTQLGEPTVEKETCLLGDQSTTTKNISLFSDILLELSSIPTSAKQIISSGTIGSINAMVYVLRYLNSDEKKEILSELLHEQSKYEAEYSIIQEQLKKQNIVVSKKLATRYKGLIQQGPIPIYGDELQENGSEGAINAIVRGQGYINQSVKDNPDRFNIFIGHRTGEAAFYSIKHNIKAAAVPERYKNTGNRDIFYQNSNGEKLHQTIPGYIDLYLLSENEKNKLIEEFSERSNVLKTNTIFGLQEPIITQQSKLNTNMLMLIDYFSSCISKGKKGEIEKGLKQKNYIYSSVLEAVKKNDQSNGYQLLCELTLPFEDVDNKYATLVLETLYQGRGNDGNTRKQFYKHLFQKNKSWLMGGDFMKNQDFHNYYNELEEKNKLLTSEEFKVNSFSLGITNIDAIYSEQSFKDINGNIITGDELIQILVNDLSSHNPENIAIIGPGGSGKSTFSKHLYRYCIINSIKSTYLKASNFEQFMPQNEKLVIIDGFDESSQETQNSIYRMIESDLNRKYIILGRSVNSDKLKSLSCLSPSKEEFNKAVTKYTKNFKTRSEQDYFAQFIKEITPHLSESDLTLQMLDVLGMISQSRTSFSLISKKDIKRSDIFESYLFVQQDKSFEKYKNNDPTIISNDLVGKEYDNIRSSFMQYIATHFATFSHTPETNKIKTNNLQFTIEELQELYDDFIDTGSNDKFCYDWANKKIDAEGGNFSQLLQKRFMMFVDALVATGLLQKNAGSDIYEIPHKTLDDYMRYTTINDQQIEKNALFINIQYRSNPMGTYNFLKDQPQLLKTLISNGTYRDENEPIEQAKKAIEVNKIDLYRLLDSYFFNGYDGFFETIVKVKGLLGSKIGNGLFQYIQQNLDQIVNYHTNLTQIKYDHPDISHINSYKAAFEHFILGGSGSYGGPTMREMASNKLGIELHHVVTRSTVNEDHLQLGGVSYSHDELLGKLNTTLQEIEKMCFGPITRKHAWFLYKDHTFGNCEEDIKAAQQFRDQIF